MSVFSLIKRSRQAAKEQNAKKAEKDKAEAKVPYKHVPKHAAVDALMGGPTGWKEADRLRIMEENRRRSAMTANGMGMPSGLSTPVHAGVFTRSNTSLTHVSYSNPSGYATPVPHIPRAYSYHGTTPGWSHHGGEISYLSIDMAGAASSGTSIKGKEKEVRRPRLDYGPTSRSSSRLSAAGGRFLLEGGSGSAPRTRDGSSSPVQSSSNSSSSEDDLEIKPVKQYTSAVTTSSPLAGLSSRPVSDTDSVHRLHPGHARNMSNSSYKQAGRSSSPRQSPSRSSPTRAGGGSSSNSSASLSAAGIPPVPSIPPMQFGGTLALPTSSSSSSSNNSGSNNSSSHRSSHPIPPPMVVEEDASELSEDSLQSTGTGTATPPIGTAVSTAPGPTARTAAALEPIQSNVVSNTTDNTHTDSGSGLPYKKYSSQKERSFVATTALPTSFDEASLAVPQQLVTLPQQLVTLPQQPAKLGKRPKNTTSKEEGRKKSRWSFMSSRRTAVAV
ncbi:hypothetical protein B0H65DRAFT_433446 [Neurospora tetraspora]|uniref:Uncharacterized protein n=1 Tax=Neurospora tetraspora TaxID=94610 RepID=A0AAE0J9C4_9PEZI|nr:hypothetical protein B0H65DRAFT_433446 [Neurospora tetraspora]